MTALPLLAAAGELGISEPTLRRWIARGAPVAKRGRRGRGCETLVEVAAIAAWRGARPDELRALAGEIPELVSDACWEAFLLVEGPHRTAAAGVLAGTWYVVTTSLLDRLRAAGLKLEEPAIPEKIDHLRAIFGDARRTGAR